MTETNGTPDAGDSDENDEQLEEGTLISHLIELRSRLLKAGLGVLAVFVCLAPFSDFVFTTVATPLMQQLPEGSTMIATQVASPFLTPFKLTLCVALFLAMPVVIYQIWAFVAPGLYRKEKRFGHPVAGFECPAVLSGGCVCLHGRLSTDVCVFYSGSAGRRSGYDRYL